MSHSAKSLNWFGSISSFYNRGRFRINCRIGLYHFKTNEQVRLCSRFIHFCWRLRQSNDRAINEGPVVDFMLLQYGPLRTDLFNVTDVAIMMGLFGFILATSKQGQQITGPPT